MNTLAEIIRTYDIVAIQEIRDRSQVALNADGSYFDEDKASSLSGGEYCWLIDNGMDTTTGNTDCTYDRIIITENTESHFTGDAGCTQYDLEYNLTPEETGAVSDHYPVYAEFTVNSGET